MQPIDRRWIQRLQNFEAAFTQLQRAADLSSQRALSELELQGAIQSFEFTHELAWNTLKDFLTEQGVTGLSGSKDVAKMAFRMGLVEDGEVWMKMIVSRNQTSHTYNRATANEIAALALGAYKQEFTKLLAFFHRRLKEESSNP